ncbi:MAG: guanylate kinase [Saprospiraceae bacterium]|nr:guanylate kinase [Saprospiraceae bacterium]
MQGKLIIFSAPSGAGKTTIVKNLLDVNKNLEFSVSACSRPKRNNEIHGKDYYFLSVDDFKSKIENNEFVEWEEVYCNQFYGTLKSEIERIWQKGNAVVFDVDVIGGLNLKKQFEKNALAIFVMPPSIEELEKRLKNRSSEDDESISKRISKAKYELSFAEKFDITILNDDLKTAIEKANQIVNDFIIEK